MIVVCDMGPLHYLVLMGAEHVLPQLFTRVLTPPVVLVEITTGVGGEWRMTTEIEAASARARVPSTLVPALVDQAVGAERFAWDEFF